MLLRSARVKFLDIEGPIASGIALQLPLSLPQGRLQTF